MKLYKYEIAISFVWLVCFILIALIGAGKI